MVGFYLSFVEKYPETFSALQESVDRIAFPVKLRLGKEGPFESLQKQKLGGFVPVIFDGTETNVWMYLDPIDTMGGIDHLKPEVGDRNLVITFEYHSAWRPHCCSLLICAALMSDFDALTYNDFMHTGFTTIEETIKGAHSLFDKFQGTSED